MEQFAKNKKFIIFITSIIAIVSIVLFFDIRIPFFSPLNLTVESESIDFEKEELSIYYIDRDTKDEFECYPNNKVKTMKLGKAEFIVKRKEKILFKGLGGHYANQLQNLTLYFRIEKSVTNKTVLFGHFKNGKINDYFTTIDNM